MFEYKLEYYMYNIEEDKFVYDWNFKKLYKMYEQLDSHNKCLGVAIIDEIGRASCRERVCLSV